MTKLMPTNAFDNCVTAHTHLSPYAIEIIHVRRDYTSRMTQEADQ